MLFTNKIYDHIIKIIVNELKNNKEIHHIIEDMHTDIITKLKIIILPYIIIIIVSYSILLILLIYILITLIYKKKNLI